MMSVGGLNMWLKADKWWVYKIAGGLLTVVLLTVVNKVAVNAFLWSQLALLFSAFVALAVFGHLINDITDLESDRLAGKQNLADRMGAKTAIIVCLLCPVLALSVVSLLDDPVISVLVVIQILLNVAYSVRPIRLKERGVLAMVVTGFYERTLPYLMIAYLLLGQRPEESEALLIAYLAWSFLWEVRNFVSGQKKDRHLDMVSGQKTVSVLMPDAVLNPLHWGIFVLEMGFFLVWSFWLPQWWVAVPIAFSIALYFHQRDSGTFRIRKDEVFNIVDDVYNLGLPVLLAAYAVLTYSSALWLILVLLLVAFNNHFRLLFIIWAKNVDWKWWLRAVTFPIRMVRLVANWSIYYFRKWVLKWPEERNWGKHYEKHLEKERQKQERRMQ